MLSRAKGHAARIAMTLAASVLALASSIVALPQPAAHAEKPHGERLNKKYAVADTDYPVPQSNVLWVSPEGDDGAAGAQNAPLKSVAAAAKKATDGTTIVLKSGVYREPHFSITKSNVTLQAAPHAEVWLKGSDVVGASRWKKDGKVWKVTGDFQNFCHVCTTNAKPSVEGIAAFPEQVFIGDQPLKQVDSKDKVGPGTFYVEDATPTTLKVADDRTKGYNVGKQDSVTYYVGSDPTAGTTEISQRSRAFTSTGSGLAMKGVNVAQFAPNHAWDFNDPRLGKESGPVAVSVNGAGSVIQDGVFAQSSSTGFFFDHAENSRFVNNKVYDNGATGLGGNRTHGTTVEKSVFSASNAAGMEIDGTKCKGYCTVGDVKITHAKDVTFRENVVDYSGRQVSHVDKGKSTPPGFWCDEGCINAVVVNNFFTNSSSAIFIEVSAGGVVASNVIESSGMGITLSGSERVKVYNNTVSRTLASITVNEDERSNGCNAVDANRRCIANESWSQEQHLSWDATKNEVYNNIVSSRPGLNGSRRPWWSYPIRTAGGADEDGSSKLYSNSLFTGLDYNAYYRNGLAGDPYLMTWDTPEGAGKTDVRFSRTKDIAEDSRTDKRIDGLERHALDQFGARSANPFFVKEADGDADFKKSDYHLKAGSPARGSGKTLPADVAKAIDPSGTTVKPNAAVDRGALVNVKMKGDGG